MSEPIWVESPLTVKTGRGFNLYILNCTMPHKFFQYPCLFGGVPKLGRPGRIEFGSGGVPPHVLLRGHFRAQISLSAKADKRPQAAI